MINVDRKKIEEVINNSEDLITALEAVGAMYCIPPSHILQDDAQQTIKVVNDTIIAPNRKSAIANTQSIVCAIGAVLDHISQRIDDKLDNFQADAIDKSKLDSAVANADPNKGSVVKRIETDDGDEIIVYDSGIVDRPLTKSAIMKVAELKRNGEIPERKETPTDSGTSSYFSDADDITAGVDTGSASDPTSLSDTDGGSDVTDVAASVNESVDILDLIAKYNDTLHLGYDIFSEMGFDIKPVDSDYYQEAAKSKKKSKTVKASDIKHMKFDNKHIIAAVKYFNAARKAQPNVKFAKDLDIQKFINDPNYSKGVHELEAQFDCHLSYKWLKDANGYQNAGTYVFDGENEHKNAVTISKSKGFQLHGVGIWVEVWNYGLFSDAPVDISIFGQALVAVTLHEIFHNIAAQIRAVTNTFLVNTAATVSLMISSRSAKAKRAIANKYLDTVASNGSIKINNPMKRRALVKYMMLLSSLRNDIDVKNVIDNTNAGELSESEIDKTIASYSKKLKEYKRTITRKTDPVPPFLAMLTGMCLALVGSTVAACTPMTLVGVFLGITGSGAAISKLAYGEVVKELRRLYKEGKALEEGWCDMFAGIYNYPVAFYIHAGQRGGENYTPNTVKDKEKLNKLAAVEKELFSLLLIKYPTNSERNHAAAKLAENALKQKGLDPATKKYLTWIKDNYSSMLDTDIENEEANSTYDPNRAGDVDKHIQDIINQGNVAVTESFA